MENWNLFKNMSLNGDPNPPVQLLILQADYGDCLILKYINHGSPSYILIDGGPHDTFEAHLKPVLKKIKQQGGRLDLVVLSHVDNDHILGLKDLFSELHVAKEKNQPMLIEVKALWHNSYAPQKKMLRPFEATIESVMADMDAGIEISEEIFGVKEGNSLRQEANYLEIPINPEFPTGIITVDGAPRPVSLGNLSVWIIGPTHPNLEALHTQWNDWIEANLGEPGLTPYVPVEMDRSVPNLSSIAFLAGVGGKRMLFTGDLPADAILEGLAKAKLVDQQGKMQVDLLKIPHHGSDRNVTQAFLENISARTYVISANDHGRTINPDFLTLQWIVESAKKRGQFIELIFTNTTHIIEIFRAQFSTNLYPYSITILDPNSHGYVWSIP
jgi:beta-lactamase superfamily II metal-dependent hydrolase